MIHDDGLAPQIGDTGSLLVASRKILLIRNVLFHGGRTLRLRVERIPGPTLKLHEFQNELGYHVKLGPVYFSRLIRVRVVEMRFQDIRRVDFSVVAFS